MSWVIVYAVVFVAMLYADAITCYAGRRRFRIGQCIVLCAIWPVTLPMVLFGVAFLTRNDPPTGSNP